MSAATLLNDPSDPNYAFDHDLMHRRMAYSVPGSYYPAFSFMLDPMQGTDVPAGDWDTAHAKAHSDFASKFPTIYWPSTVAINDINLDTGATNWWALSNKNLHDLANSVLPTG